MHPLSHNWILVTPWLSPWAAAAASRYSEAVYQADEEAEREGPSSHAGYRRASQCGGLGNSNPVAAYSPEAAPRASSRGGASVRRDDHAGLVAFDV